MNFLIIGDSCIDEYFYCNSERLCPEAPVPLLDVLRHTKTEGMAGNVYNNLKKLTDNVEFITNKNFSNITKSRYVDEKTNHMFVRIDSKDKIERINLQEFYTPISNADVVIISDYNKGYLKEEDILEISKINSNTFLDTKKVLGDWACNIKFIKINRKEYDLSYKQIKKYKLTDKIIKTIGSGGAVYRDKVYPVSEAEVKDLSGAGDTFIASLAYNFYKTKNIEKSIAFANECATIVVSKKGTSTL